MQGLHLYFTPEGIRAELGMDADEQAVQWVDRWGDDPYGAIYDYGLLSHEDASAVGGYIHTLVKLFWKKLTDLPELEMLRGKVKVALIDSDIELLLQALPFALGAEAVNAAWLKRMFKGLNGVFKREIAAFDGTVALYLTGKHQNLRVPERIFFHLVENKDDQYPFAFLATYASRDSAGKVGHYPLKYALTEYAEDRKKLISLLNCLNGAAEASELIAEFMEKGELFHPLKLTASEAYDFLKSVPAIEAAGILCRIPNWWRSHAATPQITMELGGKKPAVIGADALISIVPELTVDGVALSREEIASLLRQTEGLANLKGKWIAVDHNKLQALLKQMESLGGEVSLLNALKMGMRGGTDGKDSPVSVRNGQWLSEQLYKLRNPKEIPAKRVPKDFRAKLRPYQKTGFQWLNYMSELGFGACLADDMGLGKTVQVLAYLDTMRKEKPDSKCLLIVPASLLGNWQREAERFAPEMPVEVFHGRSAQAISADLKSRSTD